MFYCDVSSYVTKRYYFGLATDVIGLCRHVARPREILRLARVVASCLDIDICECVALWAKPWATRR